MLDDVLASAARLQEIVPGAVLVGDAAAAMHARHRESFDHDHVLADLAERYAEVVEAVEATDGWVTSVRASSPPLTLLGSLDGVEAGLRQLRRTRAGEVEEVRVGTRVQRLSEPNPRDSRVTTQLTAYKGLVARWQRWAAVVDDCAALADAIVERRSAGGA